MSLLMSNDEICRDYRLSKDRNKQVRVLAELNGTSPDRILEILAEAGEITGTPQHRAAAKDKQASAQAESEQGRAHFSAKHYIGLADKGFTVAETAEALGVTKDAVYRAARRYGVRFAGMKEGKKKGRPVNTSHKGGKTKNATNILPPQPAEVNPPKEGPETNGACAARSGVGVGMVEAMQQLLRLAPEIIGAEVTVTACGANGSEAVVIAETENRSWRLSLTEERGK